MDKVLNETLKEDFARFTANLGRSPTVSGPEAAIELDASILEATRVCEHTNDIRPYVKENTRAEANFNNAENEILTIVEHAYQFVETIGGKVDKTTKQEFLDQGPMQSLEQAFDQVSTPQNFGKLLRKPPAVVGSRIFIRNYQKEQNHGPPKGDNQAQSACMLLKSKILTAKPLILTQRVTMQGLCP